MESSFDQNFVKPRFLYNILRIVIAGFAQSAIDIETDIPRISSDIFDISNQKNRYTRVFKNI